MSAGNCDVDAGEPVFHFPGQSEEVRHQRRTLSGVGGRKSRFGQQQHMTAIPADDPAVEQLRPAKTGLQWQPLGQDQRAHAHRIGRDDLLARGEVLEAVLHAEVRQGVVLDLAEVGGVARLELVEEVLVGAGVAGGAGLHLDLDVGVLLVPDGDGVLDAGDPAGEGERDVLARGLARRCRVAAPVARAAARGAAGQGERSRPKRSSRA